MKRHTLVTSLLGKAFTNFAAAADVVVAAGSERNLGKMAYLGGKKWFAGILFLLLHLSQSFYYSYKNQYYTVLQAVTSILKPP